MVKICLSRVGKKKQPSYRVIVVDKQKDPWGSYLEIVGRYDPLARPRVVEFKKERVLYWLSVGAQASPTVHNFLVDAGVIAGVKRKASKNKKVAVQAEAATTPVESAKAPDAAPAVAEVAEAAVA